MMTAWQMYWIVKLDDIISIFEGGMGMSVIIASVLVLGGFLYWVEYDEAPGKWFKRGLIWCSVVFAASLLIGSATPSTKQLAAIVVVPKLVNSEVIQKDIPELYELALDWTKKQLAE